MKAKLVLEDARVFEGHSFGARGERFGEVVFNTSLTGYQEILTDPSYKGQIVTMTYPLIGNYGVNSEDVESVGPCVEGFVVKEVSRIASNWRSEKTLDEYLKENKVVGIEGVDTRALTKHIRIQGAMKAVVSTEDTDTKSLVKKVRAVPGLIGRDLVKEVTCDDSYSLNDKGTYRVVVIDCGVKFNILRNLASLGCQIVVVPAHTKASAILSLMPDGLFLSNGPGDPAAVGSVPATVKKLVGKLPIYGICLGHQMLGLALGGKTYKLKFGHHGGNHPVKDLRSGTISITAQNHGFCVDFKTLQDDIEMTHINLNDSTLEGFRHKKLPLAAVQFHPEAAPGPHDAAYLFGDFISMMKNNA
ncbi:glutamine-hydrolyzing carbamoyl-phosphate synthase small subunit [Thermoproteota archaeon]